MRELRVIIAGGRDFNDYNLLERNVNFLQIGIYMVNLLDIGAMQKWLNSQLKMEILEF